jgi:hypothetical protein
MKFKVGDKVKYIGKGVSSCFSFGKTYTVKYIGGENTPHPHLGILEDGSGYDHNPQFFELITSSPKPDNNFLLDQANAGLRALEELLRLNPKRVQGISKHGTEWEIGESFSVKVLPAYTMEHWVTSNGWDISINGVELQIGCAIFKNVHHVGRALEAILIKGKDFHPCTYDFVNTGNKHMIATRNGLMMEGSNVGSILPRGDANRLYNELKKMGFTGEV